MGAIKILSVICATSAVFYGLYKGIQYLREKIKVTVNDDAAGFSIMGGICKAAITVAKFALLVDVTTTVAAAAQPAVVVVVEEAEPVSAALVRTDEVVITNVVISGTRLDANIPVEPPVIADAINRMGRPGFDDRPTL